MIKRLLVMMLVTMLTVSAAPVASTPGGEAAQARHELGSLPAPDPAVRRGDAS